MSSYERKNGDVSIFKNDEKTGKQPDYKGYVKTPSGEDLDISLWISESKSGKKYFSGKIQEPYKKEATEPVQKEESTDDLPF